MLVCVVWWMHELHAPSSGQTRSRKRKRVAEWNPVVCASQTSVTTRWRGGAGRHVRHRRRCHRRGLGDEMLDGELRRPLTLARVRRELQQRWIAGFHIHQRPRAHVLHDRRCSAAGRCVGPPAAAVGREVCLIERRHRLVRPSVLPRHHSFRRVAPIAIQFIVNPLILGRHAECVEDDVWVRVAAGLGDDAGDGNGVAGRGVRLFDGSGLVQVAVSDTLLLGSRRGERILLVVIGAVLRDLASDLPKVRWRLGAGVGVELVVFPDRGVALIEHGAVFRPVGVDGLLNGVQRLRPAERLVVTAELRDLRVVDHIPVVTIGRTRIVDADGDKTKVPDTFVSPRY